MSSWIYSFQVISGGHSFPLWAVLLTQLPLPIWSVVTCAFVRRRQYQHFQRFPENYSARDGKLSSFLWQQRRGILKDALVIILATLVVVMCGLPGSSNKLFQGGIPALWVLTILVDQIRERKTFLTHLGWNMVDLMIVVCACWCVASTRRFMEHQSADQVVDPVATLFLISQASNLVFPFSVLAFFAFLRLLRYLDVFPCKSM